MGGSTDNATVNPTDDLSPSRMDRVLMALPPSHVVASNASARFVVGPSGAFVLLSIGSPDAVNGSAARLDLLVRSTRAALCDHLSWVPFLDSLLVSDTDVRRAPVTVVALDLLHDVITEGPTMIDETTLDCVREAVRSERLDHWSVGAMASAARIDLCDPAQPTSAR